MDAARYRVSGRRAAHYTHAKRALEALVAETKKEPVGDKKDYELEYAVLKIEDVLRRAKPNRRIAMNEIREALGIITNKSQFSGPITRGEIPKSPTAVEKMPVDLDKVELSRGEAVQAFAAAGGLNFIGGKSRRHIEEMKSNQGPEKGAGPTAFAL